VQNVRFWHKADILVALSNVCFRGKADIFTTLKQRLIKRLQHDHLPQNHGISKSFYGAYDPNQSSNEKPICASLDASGSLSVWSGKAGSRALAMASAICSRGVRLGRIVAWQAPHGNRVVIGIGGDDGLITGPIVGGHGF
jgi:hypothetical protein